MQLSRRHLLEAAALSVAAGALGGLEAPPAVAAPADPLLHLLRRVTYGPRAADVALVQRVGVAAYLDQQLHPELIHDPALRKAMLPFKLLDWNRKQILNVKDPAETCRRALIQGRVVRAVTAQAQLFEQMVEFWSDHFNVASDGLEIEVVQYERMAIRPNALGRFEDLLVAVAQSPAMLYFLNNADNVSEHPNENYGRELMELHTLGVGGGYTEADVKAVARAFTGWTVDDKRTGGFMFDAQVHDADPKVVLGHTLPGGRGVQDGLDVLALLAAHPSTAHFICRKLAIRFVSDSPPASLVDALAATFTAQNGDIRAVLRALFLSDEFAASAGQKLRRPFDHYVGALRATGTGVKNYYALEYQLTLLGQVPYDWHPPNGYPEPARAWANTNGLLARWNTAFQLAIDGQADRKDYTGALRHLLGKPASVGELVDRAAVLVFAAPLADPLRGEFIALLAGSGGADTPVTKELLTEGAPLLVGLMLASPQYQWR